jgi:light-regulated signal transduction histidine kinase (bacteriophytochrome)
MSKGSILAVDDTLSSLKLLADILTAEGYEVRPANSGELALASVAARLPELILLDIRMPGIDGFEVLRRLRATPESSKVPVIFLSAVAELEARVEGLKLGAVDFVSKPFQREELLARVKTHVELFRLRQLLEQKAESALARNLEELQRFAEISAHHLQEPVRRVASYAERLSAQLEGKLDDPDARLSLDFISQQARHLQEMLRAIERYLAAAQARAAVGLIGADRLVAGVLERLADRVQESGAEVLLGELPKARIDAPRLADMFAVTLENALIHGRGERALKICVEGERVGSLVRYSVSDNGPGVEAEYRERVFRVFERLSSQGSGTGIGLAILRRVAESCDGRAWMEASPEGGCRVVFELPGE